MLSADQIDEKEKELQFYKEQLDQLSGKIINMQYTIAHFSNEINRLRRGYELTASLHRSYKLKKSIDQIYSEILDGFLVKLKMDGAAIILHDNDHFKVKFFKGYNAGKEDIMNLKISLPEDYLQAPESFFINRFERSNAVCNIFKDIFEFDYFICTPVLAEDKILALLYAGRRTEVKTLGTPPLTIYDVEVLESIAGLIAAIHSQVEHVKGIEKERERISREMHDDIGSELTKISLITQMLSLPMEKETFDSSLNKLSFAAGRVIDQMNEVIWTLNTKNDTLLSLISYIRENGSTFFDMHQLQYTFEITENLPSIELKSDCRRNLLLAVKEVFHNIIKHSKADHVSITIDVINNELLILIWDNGIGIESMRVNGQGLENMKQRIKDCNGEIEIISRPGTTVKISVPIKSHLNMIDNN